MKKNLTIALLLTLCTLPATAQDWSVGVGTGAFVFGDFVERRIRSVAGGTATPPTIQTLSAGTRAGLAVDIERSFSERWAIQLNGTFTRAPLAIKSEDDVGDFELEAGDMDVAILSAPIIFRINRGGTFRFYLMGGPAYGIYKPRGRQNVTGSLTVFEETRNEWGAMAGAGVAWVISGRFSVEGEISDTVTSSPFHREDFPDVPGFSIPKPHNIHTIVGIRYRF
jgi:opacity protein-like surface antigen